MTRPGAARSYRIDIGAEEVADLRRRLVRARWADDVTGEETDWSWGTPPAVLGPLVSYWRDHYDWHRTQDRWNAYEQQAVTVDGVAVHVLRAGRRGGVPLMLVHGWPDGFLRFEKALPLLSDRFDLMLPSIPGFGFSQPSAAGWGPHRVADAFVAVAEALGAGRFGVHGADLGSGVAEAIALRHPDRVLGIHLGDVPAWHRYGLDAGSLSDDETAFADGMSTWLAEEGAYAALQRTKPQTLGWALADSPIGLAAWIAEKLRTWSDGDGELTGRFSVDEILDDVSLYWFSGTAASSVRYYREVARERNDPSARVAVPTGFTLFTLFPRDIACPPPEYAERFFDVRHFAVMPRGGHFGPWEEPELWAEDLRRFFDLIA